MINNMNKLNLNEMEKINGGRCLYKGPDEITLEDILARRLEQREGLDLSEFKKRIQQETPDMIDPELLRDLAEQLRKLNRPQ